MSMSVHTNGVKPDAARKTSGSGKTTRYQPRASQGTFDWGSVEAAAIGECVAAVVNAGDAILFGSSRDGGTGVITVCSGERRIKFYATTPLEMGMHLADIENAATSE